MLSLCAPIHRHRQLSTEKEHTLVGVSSRVGVKQCMLGVERKKTGRKKRWNKKRMNGEEDETEEKKKNIHTYQDIRRKKKKNKENGRKKEETKITKVQEELACCFIRALPQIGNPYSEVWSHAKQLKILGQVGTEPRTFWGNPLSTPETLI